MARVLLINSNRLKQPWPVFPFGLCCVAASVEEAGHEVRFLDLCFAPDCERAIRDAIRQFAPDAVGISIRNIDNSTACKPQFFLDKISRRVVRPCKAAFTGPIVIGGPAVGISGAEMLRFFGLSFAVRGDGEVVMVEFLNRLERGQPMEGLKGLVIYRDGEIIQDPEPAYVEDLNTLPFPRPQRYLDLGPYREFDSPLQIQTKRGCALDCSYCTYNRIEGRRYRLREPQLIADQVEELVRETGIDHVEFTDSTFNIPLDHAKAVLKAIAAKNLRLRLHTMGLNPACVDEELVDLMREVGFTAVDFGVEAGCDAILKNLGKNYTVADVVRASELLREKQIPILWFLLVGAPGETPQTLTETFRVISELASPWDLVNIGVGIRVYNGSPIAEDMLRENPGCTQDDFLHPVSLEPAAIDVETMKAVVKRAALRHPNFFMYDEDEAMSRTVLKIGFWMVRTFAPRQPVWRLHILLRRLQSLLGIMAIRRIFFERRNRALLQAVRAADGEPHMPGVWGDPAQKNV